MPNVVNWREAQPVVSHDSAIVWSCLLPETTCRISNKDESWLTYLIVATR